MTSVYIHEYDGQAIARSVQDEIPQVLDGLQKVLRAALTIETGLAAYLHHRCGCVFVQLPDTAEWSMISSREPDQGERLYRGEDFLAMLEIAMARKIDE